MRKKLLIFLTIPLAFMTGCSKLTQTQTSNEDTAKNTLSNKTHDVFSGIWVRHDKNANMYFKIRENSIEYQSSETFFNNYDLVENIGIDETGKHILLEINSHIEEDILDTIKIEVIDDNTILLEGKPLYRLTDTKSAVSDLYPIFYDIYPDSSEYSLESFLEISIEELNHVLTQLNNK